MILSRISSKNEFEIFQNQAHADLVLKKRLEIVQKSKKKIHPFILYIGKLEYDRIVNEHPLSPPGLIHNQESDDNNLFASTVNADGNEIIAVQRDILPEVYVYIDENHKWESLQTVCWMQ